MQVYPKICDTSKKSFRNVNGKCHNDAKTLERFWKRHTTAESNPPPVSGCRTVRLREE